MVKMVVEPLKNNTFKVVQEVEYLGVKIPKDFTSNGANIPRLFWIIYPPFKPKYLKAIILHDYLCANADSKAKFKEADEYLKKGLKDCGAGFITQNVFYYSVRIYHEILKPVKWLLKGI